MPGRRGSARPAGPEGGRAGDRVRGLRLGRGHGEVSWPGSSRRAPRRLPQQSRRRRAGLLLARAFAQRRAGCSGAAGAASDAAQKPQNWNPSGFSFTHAGHVAMPRVYGRPRGRAAGPPARFACQVDYRARDSLVGRVRRAAGHGALIRCTHSRARRFKRARFLPFVWRRTRNRCPCKQGHRASPIARRELGGLEPVDECCSGRRGRRHRDPNQVVSASRNPVSVPSPTQATYPSGRIRTAAGAAT